MSLLCILLTTSSLLSALAGEMAVRLRLLVRNETLKSVEPMGTSAARQGVPCKSHHLHETFRARYHLSSAAYSRPSHPYAYDTYIGIECKMESESTTKVTTCAESLKSEIRRLVVLHFTR